MKNLFKGNRHFYKIVLAGLGIVKILAMSLSHPAPANQPTRIHIEGSYEPSKGAKVIIDKR